MAKAAVLGASGYLGGELLRLIVGHPQLELSNVVSSSHAGTPITELYPNLPPQGSLLTQGSTDRIDAEIAFLAQPPGEAMKVVPGLIDRGIKVVDLGPDYRLPDASVYQSTYRQPHTDTDHLPEAVYGLPELFREQIRHARLVANPGCFPTATLLAIAPILKQRGAPAQWIVDAKSGTSGAGSGFSTTTHHPEAAPTVWPYGLPMHRHVPEMASAIARAGGATPSLVFGPHLVPIVRGILCTIYPVSSSPGDPTAWPELLRTTYAKEPFVRVGGTPRLTWTQGTNLCFLSSQSAGAQPVLFSALDNLGKGGATQAVQNANLLFGWDETTGLSLAGFGV
jgi:N-acetyl-gamma-glutamyl-phosphate reductase